MSPKNTNKEVYRFVEYIITPPYPNTKIVWSTNEKPPRTWVAPTNKEYEEIIKTLSKGGIPKDKVVRNIIFKASLRTSNGDIFFIKNLLSEFSKLGVILANFENHTDDKTTKFN